MNITRHPNNPIVVPGKYDWRSAVTFNPAAIIDDGRFYLFERAAGSLRPFRCRIGLLASDDGIAFEHVLDKPVFTPEAMDRPEGTVEDPRVVKIDGVFYMVFAHRPFTYHCHPTGVGVPDYYPIKGDLDTGINHTRSGIAKSNNMKDWEFVSFITPPDIDDRDNVPFPEKIAGRYAMLRRPISYVGENHGCSGPSIWISYSDDLLSWTEPVLVARAENDWEGGKIGASAPPIRTDSGWLTLYHGVDADSIYRVGVMLLDLDNPKRVVARCPDFIMEPEMYYEKFGLVIPNVIFPTAALIKDAMLYIYYGCADTSIALATVPIEEIVEHTKRFPC